MVFCLSNPTALSRLNIEGITEPILLRYFETINAGDFEKTATLFAPHGELHAPFMPELVGRNAIALYFSTENPEIVLNPRKGQVWMLENGTLEVKITGSLTTSLFRVDADWQFRLDSHQEILCAKTELLTSARDLLALNY